MRKRYAKSENDKELSDVNVTPLADVSLTLIIVIMIISPMILQSMIQVQAGAAVATTKKNQVKEKPVFVDITSDGYSINKSPVRSEYEFFRVLQRVLAKKREKTVMISSADDVRYQYVVRALDIVKQSGARSLSLVPRKKGKKS